MNLRTTIRLSTIKRHRTNRPLSFNIYRFLFPFSFSFFFFPFSFFLFSFFLHAVLALLDIIGHKSFALRTLSWPPPMEWSATGRRLKDTGLFIEHTWGTICHLVGEIDP